MDIPNTTRSLSNAVNELKALHRQKHDDDTKNELAKAILHAETALLILSLLKEQSRRRANEQREELKADSRRLTAHNDA
jgi:hypothetical protein